MRLKEVYPSASGVFTVCTADAQRVRDVFGSDVVDTLGDDVNAIVYQRNDNMILSETYDRAHIDLCLDDHTEIRDVTGEVLSFVQDGDKWALHGLEGVPVEDEIGDPVNWRVLLNTVQARARLMPNCDVTDVNGEPRNDRHP